MKTQDKATEAKVRKLCQKFYDDLQAVFDSADMNEAVYDGAVCQAAVMAQGYAEDAANA